MKSQNKIMIERVIVAINNELDFLQKNAIFSHDEEQCSGGMYAEYKRFLYKPDSIDELNELKDKFEKLNRSFVDLHFFARKTDVKKYKNTPFFIDEPISSATIKISTAFQSQRVYVSERKKMQNTYYKLAGGTVICADDDEAKAQIENYRIIIRARLEEIGGAVETEVIDDGRRQLLRVSLSAINKYLQSQNIKPKQFTIRKETGRKYTASLMPMNDELEVIQNTLGVVIVHPESKIASCDVYRPIPRKPSAKSLERSATKLDKLGGLSIGNFMAKIWYQ